MEGVSSGGEWEEGMKGSGLRVRREELAFLCSDMQHTFPLVTNSVMWMAVLVCKVRGPVLILEVPLARAMRMMSWQNKIYSIASCTQRQY